MFKNHVLTFHVIDDSAWWESLIISLKKRFTMVSMEDIERYYYNGTKLKKSCHITFDDGHKSLYDNVFPIVKKHNIPISVYVSPKIISEQTNFWFQEVDGFEKEKVLGIISEHFSGNTEKYKEHRLKNIFKSFSINDIHTIINHYRKDYNLEAKPYQNITKEQMLEMQESGLVTFGAHTLNHPVLPNESDETAEYEIGKSIEWLAELTGRPVKYWAFPNGDCTHRDVGLLKKFNIKLGFSTKFGTRFHRDANPLLIPRTGFTYGSKNYLLLKMLFGKYWDKMRALKNKVT